MNCPKKQHWTLNRKYDEVQRPFRAYQTDDLSHFRLMLSWYYRLRLSLNDNASGLGGQVEKKYLDKSPIAMLSKFYLHCVLLCESKLYWHASHIFAVRVFLGYLTECQPEVVHGICFAFVCFCPAIL